ncbi:MAG: prepilin-type N-terminal cleavage/methylation domain-containing protein [Planctomycetia bacterium]|nr:prepilin-type N-terminal cleavage/methylation domain-containing protein [Planctomycetia bacterium]
MIARTIPRGYTMIELLVVMAILIVLAVVIIPSIGAFRGDSRQRAAADSIRGELAVARSRAVEEGIPYRIAISEDGKRIRRAPDGVDFVSLTGADHASSTARVVDYPLEHITLEIVAEQDGQVAPVTDGWISIAIVMPDGTCRADNVLVAINEDDRQPMWVRIRGLTGTSRVVTNANATNSNGGMR